MINSRSEINHQHSEAENTNTQKCGSVAALGGIGNQIGNSDNRKQNAHRVGDRIYFLFGNSLLASHFVMGVVKMMNNYCNAKKGVKVFVFI